MLVLMLGQLGREASNIYTLADSDPARLCGAHPVGAISLPGTSDWLRLSRRSEEVELEACSFANAEISHS